MTIEFASGDIESVCCNCAYGVGGWCKHIVATLLTCLHSPTEIVERPSLAALLDRLDLVQVQGLIQELVQKNPELIDEIDWFVSSIPAPTMVVESADVPRSKIDTAYFSSRVKQIFREGLRELEYGTEEDPISDDLLEIIEDANEHLRAMVTGIMRSISSKRLHECVSKN